jgi:hypothetical protein
MPLGGCSFPRKGSPRWGVAEERRTVRKPLFCNLLGVLSEGVLKRGKHREMLANFRRECLLGLKALMCVLLTLTNTGIEP